VAHVSSVQVLHEFAAELQHLKDLFHPCSLLDKLLPNGIRKGHGVQCFVKLSPSYSFSVGFGKLEAWSIAFITNSWV